MINLNSPTVQTMLANTPSGGMGNMPMGYGNMPTVETVYPSPHHVAISPYPDPYSMITGAGLSNYMQMPTYNFTGTLSGNPFATANGNPTYRDINQPVMGGIFNNLPIAGYSNPLMSFTGNAYGTGGNIGITPRQERYYRYLYASPEDRQAMDMGFDSMAELKSNEITVIHRLSMMAKSALGASQEEIDEIKEQMDEKIEKIEKEKTKQPTSYNPFDLSRYQRQEETLKPMHVKIVKNDEVICEINANKPARMDTFDIKNKVSLGLRIVERAEEIRAEKYANAPERQLDEMNVSAFFNEGFGIVHYYDRLAELVTTHNVTRLFDSEEYRRKIQREYGTPEMKRRILLEDQKNLRGRDQLEKDLENGLVRGGYGFMPGGQPLSPGVDPNIGSAMAVNPSTGGLYLTVPPSIDNSMDSGRFARTVMEARERFMQSLNKG